MTVAGVVVLVVACLASVASLVDATRASVWVRRRLPLDVERSVQVPRSRHRRLERALHRADIGTAPAEALRLAGGSVLVACVLGLLVGGPALALIAALLAAAGGPIALLILQGRRDRRADEGLPVVLDDVARALRAGAAPGAALAAAVAGRGATAARSDVRSVIDDVRAGLGLVEALERWSERRPTGPVRLAVGALAIGTSTGGARSRAVEAVAATLRERRAVESEASALATQARSSALVIVLAPLAFAALSSLSDPRAGAFLVGTPTGLACLAIGLALDGLGGWWMHRIVRLS